MAGLFFTRKSKNGANASPPPTVAPDTDSFYEPLPPALIDEPPEALPGVPDLYAVLGVDPRSSDDIIRYAYRKKAAKLLDARWRPGRAARQLAEVNAAYEILGKPDRRADYDRQRARTYYYQPPPAVEPLPGEREDTLVQSGLPTPGRTGRGTTSWTRPKAPRGLLEAIAIIGVVAIAIYAGYIVLGRWSQLDLGRLQDAGAAAGLPIRPRTAPAPTASPAPAPVATPRQVVVPPVVVPTTPPAPPTVAAAPTQKPSPPQGTARMSNQAPARRTEASVIARVTRDGRPSPGIPVYIILHYKTVEERFPAGEDTVATNDNGEATITFNVGDATAGYLVTVDVIAMVENEPLRLQTSFVPR
jgi:curved DNA-binding protein CbpA